MLCDTTVSINPDKATGIILNIFGLLVAIFWVYVYFKKGNTKLINKKADVLALEQLEKKVESIKCELEGKLNELKDSNKISHADMRTEITMIDQRNNDQHKEIRTDYSRGIDQLSNLISDRFDDIKDLIKAIR
jgi:hypothetical protein